MKQHVSTSTDPFADLHYVPYPAALVEAVDTLLEYKVKNRIPDRIRADDGDAAWYLIGQIFNLWRTCYSDEFDEFVTTQKAKWGNAYNEYGASQPERGGAQVRQLSEIPWRFYQMVEAVLPAQQWDKEFLLALNKRHPVFRGYQKL